MPENAGDDVAITLVALPGTWSARVLEAKP